MTILSEKGIIWGTSVKSALKLYQCLLLKGKLLSYDYDYCYKCMLFHRKFYLCVQEAGKIKEPWGPVPQYSTIWGRSQGTFS